MVSSEELTNNSFPDIAIESLRLLSINEVRKILKTRHDTIKNLVKMGKIKAVKTDKGKIKIPFISVLDFVKASSTSQNEQCGIISLEETKGKINALFEEYKN